MYESKLKYKALMGAQGARLACCATGRGHRVSLDAFRAGDRMPGNNLVSLGKKTNVKT